jgi:parallel beta-helix repeat protein
MRTLSAFVRPRPSWIVGTIGMLAFAAASPAFAVDGVIEINQAITGGTAYSITAPGTYRLTSNLFLNSGTGFNGNGINVNYPCDPTQNGALACGVTIDLNGFSISAPPGPHTGILAGFGTTKGSTPPPVQPDVTILNGTISGFAYGIIAGNDARVEGVHADNNGAGAGIQVGDSSVILNSTANFNGNDGIVCGAQCVISDNTANNNGRTGISTAGNGTISGNTVNSNGTSASGCTTCAGISAGPGSKIAGNTVSSNANEPGISVAISSLVIGNVINANGSFGLLFSGASGFTENFLSGNNNTTSGFSTQWSGGTQMGLNLCNGSSC